MKVADIRKLFAEKYLSQDFEIDKTGVKTVEIICAQFEVDENYIFGKPNPDYIKRELKWYESQSLNINDMEDPPKIWKQVADIDGFINSNYGWMVFSKENGYQYNRCLDELKTNQYTRRGTMIYNRPSIWIDYNKNKMSDFICTYAVQFLIRNDILYCNVLMRSNDAIFGFNNDKAWHQYILDKLTNDLNIKNTKMIWNTGSLHIYERHFYLLEHYIKTGETSISLKDYNLLYK